MIRSLRLPRLLACSPELSCARPARRTLSAAAPAAPAARKTTLYDFHIAHEGKMVPFAGYLLPVQYGSDGIAASHLHTRQHASLFDVSHMMQSQVGHRTFWHVGNARSRDITEVRQHYVKPGIGRVTIIFVTSSVAREVGGVKVRGKDRLEFLESVTTADLDSIRDNWATLTVFTDPTTGGILDDLIITRTALGYCNVVSNAGRRTEDQQLLLAAQDAFRARGKDVEVVFLDPDVRALVAVQGPSAVASLQPLTDVDLTHLYFMSSTLATVAGVKRCRITRCGYTGEDGVEISMPAESASHVAQALVEGGVRVAGLGARDSLRLEAGMCLYGNDIDHKTTPVEAGLAWLISKRRRERADFPGANLILAQLRSGPARKRVGLVSKGAPARAHAPICSVGTTVSGAPGSPLGEVTSGCPSPSRGDNIAMGYVKAEYAKPGTKLELQVRGKKVQATVTKLPFVNTKYYTPPK